MQTRFDSHPWVLLLATSSLFLYPIVGSAQYVPGTKTYTNQGGWYHADTGNYYAGLYASDDMQGYTTIYYNAANDPGTWFDQSWDITKGYVMAGIGKHVYGNSPGYGQYKISQIRPTYVDYWSWWEDNNNGLKRVGIDVWTSTVSNNPDPNYTANEIMIKEWWSEGPSGTYLGQFNKFGSDYKIYRFWNTSYNGFWSYEVRRESKRMATDANTGGQVEVAWVLNYLRNNHGLTDGYIRQIAVNTEIFGDYGRNYGEWHMTYVNIPNLTSNSVPEPTGVLGLMACSALGLLRRRRT
ncbi:MAG: hypothetical protein KatS3mg104_2522 [Phycisphaerae bacterium]|nr:MAG: hypothetical protein KatS3mg104_2522 [Phycisphaerae bacterium]